MEELGRYGAEKTATMTEGKGIICNPMNEIMINAKKVDGSDGEQSAFNIFKNVVLDIR